MSLSSLCRYRFRRKSLSDHGRCERSSRSEEGFRINGGRDSASDKDPVLLESLGKGRSKSMKEIHIAGNDRKLEALYEAQIKI